MCGSQALKHRPSGYSTQATRSAGSNTTLTGSNRVQQGLTGSNLFLILDNIEFRTKDI